MNIWWAVISMMLSDYFTNADAFLVFLFVTSRTLPPRGKSVTERPPLRLGRTYLAHHFRNASPPPFAGAPHNDFGSGSILHLAAGSHARFPPQHAFKSSMVLDSAMREFSKDCADAYRKQSVASFS